MYPALYAFSWRATAASSSVIYDGRTIGSYTHRVYRSTRSGTDGRRRVGGMFYENVEAVFLYTHFLYTYSVYIVSTSGIRACARTHVCGTCHLWSRDTVYMIYQPVCRQRPPVPQNEKTRKKKHEIYDRMQMI